MLTSRVHAFIDEHVWIKRDDELGPLGLGSKARKLSALTRWIKTKVADRTYEGVIAEIQVQSNFGFALAMHLREAGVPFRFKLRSRGQKPKGNAAFLELLLADGDVVDDATYDLLKHGWFEVPEGGSCEHAVAGALTLGLDICRNERELGLAFDAVVLDSGTGMTAAGAIVGMAMQGRFPRCYIPLIAGDEDSFAAMLAFVHSCSDFACQPLPQTWRCLALQQSRSFGAVSSGVLNFVRDTARTTGVLLDPIYTAKSLQTAQHHRCFEPSLKTLFVHTGGVATLSGFI